QDLVKSWVSCQAHTQTSRVHIMKGLFLQLLILYGLVISPVAGSLKDKTKTTTKPPKYKISTENYAPNPWPEVTIYPITIPESQEQTPEGHQNNTA
ncbi:Hypothetical predicted protein, partial [Lynx pardinus]